MQELEKAQQRIAALEDELACRAEGTAKVGAWGLQSQIFDCCDDALSIVGTDYTYKVASRSYETYLGLPREQIIGRSVGEVMGWKLFERALKPRLDRCLAGNTVRYESRFDFPGGSRLMRVTYTPLQGEDGKVLGVLTIARDAGNDDDLWEQLRDTERTYRDIFNATTDAIVLHDPKTLKVVDANEAFLELYGYSRDEIAELDVTDISQGNYPYSMEGALEVVRSLRSAGPQALEWWSRKKNGQLFWAGLHLKSVVVDGKERVLASMRDMTAQLQTQRTLEDREQTLRSILEAAPLLICLVNQERIVWSNGHIQTVLGYTPQEAEGAEVRQFFPDQETFERVRERMNSQLTIHGASMSGSELRHKSGALVPVVLRMAPLDREDPTREAICIVTDVSYRKEWEQALMEREARYRDLFDNAPVGVLRTTYEGQVLHLNQALARMLDYDTPAKALRAFGHDISSIYLNAARREELKDALREGEGRFVQDFEAEWVTRLGRTRILQLHLRSMEDRGRKCIDGFVTDITEKRQAELEAKERDKQLMQADKLISLGILTSGVAHEINNPNNFIALNAPLLERAWNDIRPLLDERAEQEGDFMVGALRYSRLRQHVPRLLEGIASGAQRIKNIVEEMKHFVRPDRSGPQEMVDVNLVVRSAMPLLTAKLASSRANLELELQEGLPAVTGASQQIEQVVLNLLLNALDAMAESGGRLLVQSRQGQPGWVELLVRDEGRGLPPANLAQLFTPFFTTKREIGGTGLGLAISQRIVQSHGGSLELRNNARGPGATAVVWLPVAESDATSDA